MEDKLDAIEENGEEWYKVVDEFYKSIEKKVGVAMKGEKVFVPDEVTDVVCDKCGSPMVIKTGKFGKYLACSNFPACSNNKSLKQKTPPKETNFVCDICGGKMLEREGKFGKYLACSNSQCAKTPNPSTKLWQNAPSVARTLSSVFPSVANPSTVARATQLATLFRGTCQPAKSAHNAVRTQLSRSTVAKNKNVAPTRNATTTVVN